MLILFLFLFFGVDLAMYMPRLHARESQDCGATHGLQEQAGEAPGQAG